MKKIIFMGIILLVFNGCITKSGCVYGDSCVEMGGFCSKGTVYSFENYDCSSSDCGYYDSCNSCYRKRSLTPTNSCGGDGMCIEDNF